MKIFYLTDARLPTEKAHGLQIMKTCEALAISGVQIELIAPRRRNELRDDPFTYYGIKKRFPLRKLWTLDLIRFGRVGFLIQEATFALGAARYARRKNGIIYGRDEAVLALVYFFTRKKMIWESHTGAWNRAARIVAKRCEQLVVISNGLKDFYVERGIPAGKICVIPSAIDLDAFADPQSKHDARARLDLPFDKKIVLYVGRLDGWKGTATLLAAAAFLPPEIQVVVIGGEPEQIASLRAKYPEVRFLGFRPYTELADNQSAADVLVVPNTGTDPISARFTSPLKLIAHMASGRPIVASDLPSIRELTGDEAAFFVQADDARALSDGIRTILARPESAEAIARAAKSKVAQYSWTMRAERVMEIARSLQGR